MSTVTIARIIPFIVAFGWWAVERRNGQHPDEAIARGLLVWFWLSLILYVSGAFY